MIQTTATTLLAVQTLAFWPVWHWYIERMIDGSDEPWGILALMSTAIIVVMRGKFVTPSIKATIICTVLTAIYAMGFDYFPSLIKGSLAVLALACVLSSISYQRAIQPAVAALMLLSLPLLASLQFFGGFPLRFITTQLVALFLNVVGWEVNAQGTLLHWAGEIIAVDAPCAGIKMLWSGLFLNFTLAAYKDLNLGMTWLSTSLTMFCVFIANVVRAIALFFTESGIISAPQFMHQTIGMIVFVGVALAVMKIHRLRATQSNDERFKLNSSIELI